MREINMTIAMRANKVVSNTLETGNNILDVVALSARAARDLSFVAAARAATLAAAEKVDINTFKEVDDKVNAALGR